MLLIFLLLIIFQLKHFAADYPLQNEFMLQKFKPTFAFFFPLLAHVSVHAVFTFIIAAFLVPIEIALILACCDGTIHFVMDRIKAGPKYLGRYKSLTSEQYMYYKGRQECNNVVGWDARDEAIAKLRGNKLFWWALGVDQACHHLTHYGIIYIIVLVRGLAFGI